MIDIATGLLQDGNLLRQNSENYKSFFNTVEDFLLVLDYQGNILMANSSVFDRLGYTQEELYGNTVLMLHPSDRRDEAALLISEMLSGRKLFCPIPVMTKSGFQIAVETRVSLGMWDGQPAIFGVSKDISKLKAAEENFLKSLYINPSACGLSDLDDFKYTIVNDAFYTLFGFTKDEVIGRTAMGLGILTSGARELILQKSGPDGNVAHVETELKAKNGDILHVLLTSSTVQLQDKKYRFTIVNDITARVKAEEMLRNTKIRLHTLVQAIPDLIWVKDAKGVYLSCNTMFERFFGAREADIIGKTDYDFVNKYVADDFRENDFKAIRSGKPSTNEEWVKFNDDGHSAFFETIKAPMYDLKGTVVGVLGIGRDITERYTAEMALLESEEKFKLIFEGSNDAIILMNGKRFLDCNSRTLEIFRIGDKKEFLGLNPERLYPPFQFDGKFSKEVADEKIAQAFKEGTNNFDWVYRRANGEDFPVKVRLSTLIVSGETILQCTIRDISSTEQELIIANRELVFQNQEKENRAAELIIANLELDFQNQEKEKRAAELIIANKELVFQNVEKEKRASELILANKELVFQLEEKEKRAAELIIANKELAFQNEEKKKRADELIVADKELAFQNEEKENRAAELIVANLELDFQNEEKENRASELIIANKELVFQNQEKEKRAAELILANKELVFQNKEKEKRASELVLADMELDYQNEEKEKREAANKELEAFSYSVSHDLRAPLRHIGGFVDLLIKNNTSQLDVTGLRYLNIISDSSREMGNLIDALLNFSRLSRAELQRTKINSKVLIDKIIKNFGDEFEGRNIDIQLLEIPDLKGDENLITQVWINLISNALKYSRNKEKTIIEIGGKIENDKTTFYIKDNGAGFDMKYADKLFGVFQRLHKARDFEGIGIGLANVNRIIIKHGGKCWAEGEVGVGATFFFSVPNN